MPASAAPTACLGTVFHCASVVGEPPSMPASQPSSAFVSTRETISSSMRASGRHDAGARSQRADEFAQAERPGRRPALTAQSEDHVPYFSCRRGCLLLRTIGMRRRGARGLSVAASVPCGGSPRPTREGDWRSVRSCACALASGGATMLAPGPRGTEQCRDLAAPRVQASLAADEAARARDADKRSAIGDVIRAT